MTVSKPDPAKWGGGGTGSMVLQGRWIDERARLAWAKAVEHALFGRVRRIDDGLCGTRRRVLMGTMSLDVGILSRREIVNRFGMK